MVRESPEKADTELRNLKERAVKIAVIRTMKTRPAFNNVIISIMSILFLHNE